MKVTKPHIYFWVTALLVLIIRLVFISQYGGIDINIHDTYFVIDNLAITLLLFASLLLIGSIYFLHYKFRVELFNSLTSIHLFITIGSILIVHLGASFLDLRSIFFDNEFSLSNFLNLVTVLGIIIQPILILNTIFSLLRHFINPKRKPSSFKP